MDVAAIRQDIATILGPLGFTAFAYVPPSVPQYPAAMVSVPTNVNYGESLGLAIVTVLVTVAFSAADAQDSQTRLDKALGTSDTTSIFVALNRATSPGGNWRQIHVVKAQEARYVKDNQALALVVDFEVEVYASK